MPSTRGMERRMHFTTQLHRSDVKFQHLGNRLKLFPQIVFLDHGEVSHGIVKDLVKGLHDILKAFTHDPLDLSGQTKNRVDGDRERRIFGIRLAKKIIV
ncbi:hypothetical protein AVEN_71116-1 [Araneus ventricosus]|uniref:Uncharacterized protein n=1 Tax=Araneus ventricosus TaxID=182803 RepID=A0A4Y2HJ70_ARAVE|nr:hypothetical protein AVEN_71116-1 [Araneus ventricosus]